MIFLHCLKALSSVTVSFRLNDCIEMLEDMESKGLLDMDKVRLSEHFSTFYFSAHSSVLISNKYCLSQVYHAGFFKACKTQKAVKEAFHFTKLIPNPTLSTFNMLMSVCASAQDSG